jgi:hypothetical protein
MSTTTAYGLAYIEEGQAGAIARYNETLEVLAALARKVLIDMGYDDSASVSSPSDGDCYFVDGAGSNDWSPFTNELVIYVGGTWFNYSLTDDEVWFVQSNNGVSVDGQRKYDSGGGAGAKFVSL